MEVPRGPYAAIQAAREVFTEAETAPQQGWESFIETRMREGPKGQVQLLLALAKAVSDSKTDKLRPLKKIANMLSSNYDKPEVWFQDTVRGQHVTLGNLMHGNKSIPGEEIGRLFLLLGGQFKPNTTVTNDGSIFTEQPSTVDLLAIQFGYLPDVIFRVQVKHSDRNNTPVMHLGGTRAVDQILDRQSQVVELTAIPVLSADDSRIHPDPW